MDENANTSRSVSSEPDETSYEGQFKVGRLVLFVVLATAIFVAAYLLT